MHSKHLVPRVLTHRLTLPAPAAAAPEKTSTQGGSAIEKNNIKKVIKLQVSGAFHSPLMKDVTEDLKKALSNVNFNDAIVPVYQNMTSQATIKAKDLKINLLKQIENPVNWVEIINNMDNNNINLYIETGPGNVLQGLNKRITINKTINFNEL